MFKYWIKLISSFVLITITLSTAFGAGIYIEPGASLTYVRIFEAETPGRPLRIININPSPMVYEISVVADEHRVKGYIPLPDTTWVRPAINNVRVEPYDTLEVPIIISIPNDPANNNRAWGCELSVVQSKWEEETIESRAGTQLQLGARATWLIETPAIFELPNKGKDPLSISPSIQPVHYSEQTVNQAELDIKIRNDSDETHEYHVLSYIPNWGDTIMGRVLDIFPLTIDENDWIPDPQWIRPKPKGVLKRAPVIKLAPGEVGEYPVLIDLPPSEELGRRRFEGVILIKPDDQFVGSRFVRFIINPRYEDD